MYICLVWSFINIIFSVFFFFSLSLSLSEKNYSFSLSFFLYFSLYTYIYYFTNGYCTYYIYIYILCSLSYSSFFFSDIKPLFLTGSFFFLALYKTDIWITQKKKEDSFFGRNMLKNISR
jgi:hypothetical protein